MTQIFKADGAVIPVTAVLAAGNIITQIKSIEKDKYSSAQIGFGRGKNLNKAQKGHLKDLSEVKTVKEFKVSVEDLADLKRGDQISVEVFTVGEKVKVTGWSKGKGFQGVVKRHGFHGSPKSHGHKDQERMPGSIGTAGAQRVFKGMKMGGRMGADQVTVSGLEIIKIDPVKNILYLKGAVPGARNGLLLISTPGKMEIKSAATVEVAEDKIIIQNEEPKNNQD